MKIPSLHANNRIVWYLLLVLVWYLLGWSAYDYEHLLPQVQLGKHHSWPLYFFLIDALAIGLIVFYGSILWTYRKSKQFLKYGLLGLVLLYPLLMVYATYSDLYSSFCLQLNPITRQCDEYRPPPDLTNLYLDWEN